MLRADDFEEGEFYKFKRVKEGNFYLEIGKTYEFECISHNRLEYDHYRYTIEPDWEGQSILTWYEYVNEEGSEEDNKDYNFREMLQRGTQNKQ